MRGIQDDHCVATQSSDRFPQAATDNHRSVISQKNLEDTPATDQVQPLNVSCFGYGSLPSGLGSPEDSLQKTYKDLCGDHNADSGHNVEGEELGEES